jgi:hypothetical protein
MGAKIAARGSGVFERDDFFPLSTVGGAPAARSIAFERDDPPPALGSGGTTAAVERDDLLLDLESRGHQQQKWDLVLTDEMNEKIFLGT